MQVTLKINFNQNLAFKSQNNQLNLTFKYSGLHELTFSFDFVDLNLQAQMITKRNFQNFLLTLDQKIQIILYYVFFISLLLPKCFIFESFPIINLIEYFFHSKFFISYFKNFMNLGFFPNFIAKNFYYLLFLYFIRKNHLYCFSNLL